MSALVSVILPVYNGEQFLRDSIDSIIAQSYSNWELLILDDCSTDRTAIIANEYATKDHRIKYFRNEKNLQLPENLNRGFSLAKGTYLTWTSDDNRYLPEALQRMVSVLDNHPEADFVFASCKIINAEGNGIDYISVTSDSPKWIVGINSVGACFLYTRTVYEQIGNYDPELKLVEDFDYWQRIFCRFIAIPLNEILYEYRWHKGALTSTMKKETFHQNLEKTLLKNRGGFGRLSIHQNYLYYRSLSSCRQQSAGNPYRWKYSIYNIMNIFLFRLPNKLRRVFAKLQSRKYR